MRLKRMREEMLLAKERDELIEKALVERQLAYFLVAFRQLALLVPFRMRQRFREAMSQEQGAYLDKLIHDMLTTLAKLPERIEPDWLEKLEDEET